MHTSVCVNRVASSPPPGLLFCKSPTSVVRLPLSTIPTYSVVFSTHTSPGSPFDSKSQVLRALTMLPNSPKRNEPSGSNLSSIFDAITSGSSCHVANPTSGAWRDPGHSCSLDCTTLAVEVSETFSFKVGKILPVIATLSKPVAQPGVCWAHK